MPSLPMLRKRHSIAAFDDVAAVAAVAQLFYFDAYADHVLVGLTLAETRELEMLDRVTPSLSDWDGYTMQPISGAEKRWAYLSQKHIDAMAHGARLRRARATTD